MQEKLTERHLYTHGAARRDPAVDLIKTAAILCVIAIHVVSEAKIEGRFDWLVCYGYGSAVRAAVPLFLMCTGALFLDAAKPLSMRKLFGKTILRMLTAMFFWAAAYALYHLAESGPLDLPGILNALSDVLLFKHQAHLYYIHITLLVYVCLPVIRVLTEYADRRTMTYALAVWFVLGIVYPTVSGFPPFDGLSGMPLQWKLNMAYASIGYCILGQYLKRYPLSLRASLVTAAAGLGFVFGGTVLMTLLRGETYAAFLEGMSVGVCLMAVGLFGTAYHIAPRLGERLSACTMYVSKASFCIYLVHMLVLYECYDHGITTERLPLIVSVPVLVTVCFGVCLVIYAVLSRIPWVKKWLI